MSVESPGSDNIYAEAICAKIATELVAEEVRRRHYTASQVFLQGNIPPLVKHLAFADDILILGSGFIIPSGNC